MCVCVRCVCVCVLIAVHKRRYVPGTVMSLYFSVRHPDWKYRGETMFSVFSNYCGFCCHYHYDNVPLPQSLDHPSLLTPTPTYIHIHHMHIHTHTHTLSLSFFVFSTSLSFHTNTHIVNPAQDF